MDNEEKTLDSELIFDGRVVHLRKDKVLCQNGKESYREVVDHNGGVGILAFHEGKIALVKQFRYAYKETLYEIPAVKLEKGEDSISAGKRELEEEIGYKAESVTYSQLNQLVVSCSMTLTDQA